MSNFWHSLNDVPVNSVLAVWILLGLFYIVRDFIVEPKKRIPRKTVNHSKIPEYLVITRQNLAEFDGRTPDTPLYIGVQNQIIDVERGRKFYGKGGPYEIFAGRDCTRLFAKEAFEGEILNEEPTTVDLTEAQLDSLREWRIRLQFKYDVIGELTPLIPYHFRMDLFSYVQSAGPNKQPPVIRIGNVSCQVDKYLAEVYSGRKLPEETPVAIKHINLPPDAKLRKMLVNEVDIMRRLSHKNIVKFYDAQVSQREIYICMEYCSVQMMNQRFQTKFRETEVLKIISDVADAICYLHYQKPPIVHRDIKVENILLGADMNFKLCDFGSCTSNIIPAGKSLTSAEISVLEDELDRQTTLAYRAPEMLDLYRRRGLTEKTDIWALGVLLYKLCFFVTPFEQDGKMAILNHNYTIPEFPQFSQPLKDLINEMLTDSPQKRLNIYRVLEKVYSMRGLQLQIPNIYQEEDVEEEETAETPNFSPYAAQNVNRVAPKLSPPTAQRRGRVSKNSSVQKSIGNTSELLSAQGLAATAQALSEVSLEPPAVAPAFDAFPSAELDPFISGTLVTSSKAAADPSDPFSVSESFASSSITSKTSGQVSDDAFGFPLVEQVQQSVPIPRQPSAIADLNDLFFGGPGQPIMPNKPLSERKTSNMSLQSQSSGLIDQQSPIIPNSQRTSLSHSSIGSLHSAYGQPSTTAMGYPYPVQQGLYQPQSQNYLQPSMMPPQQMRAPRISAPQAMPSSLISPMGMSRPVSSPSQHARSSSGDKSNAFSGLANFTQLSNHCKLVESMRRGTQSESLQSSPFQLPM